MNSILQTLEYHSILNKLQNYAKTYLGKSYCIDLLPIFQYTKISSLLEEVSEATSFVQRRSTPPISEIEPIEEWLKLLSSNRSLCAKALLEVATILKIARELKNYFYEDTNIDLVAFHLLENYFTNLYSNPVVEKKIFDTIIEEDIISDNASAKLSSLRRNRRKIEQEIRDKLNHFLHSSYSKYLMDSIITIRNSRFVIPVKQEYQNEVKGFVHDVSSSGSTVYMEPMNVFEMNNQINHLKAEEEIEIERILEELSASLYALVEPITLSLEMIGKLDFLFAKANFALSNDYCIPHLSEKKEVHLLKAKHPLLDSSNAVPIEIHLGQTYTSLVITGPNTGGKTVSLKTIGLLLLMVYSGLPVPCDEKSSIFVFDKLFADIGDEQSIQESLSTFSSHMTNIVEILRQVTNSSLVLLDELGSGTDPIEGASLAISILEHLHYVGCLSACTTHYSELKKFAFMTEGFENASFEFDVENLKPTYHLLVGIPGKSNAFAISQKLGLPSSILEKATSLLTEDTIAFEEILKNIYDSQKEIEKQKEETAKNLVQIELLRKSLEKDNFDLLEKREKFIENAKIEARDLLLSVKEEVNDTIQKLTNCADTKEANRLRNQLNDKLREVNQIHMHEFHTSNENYESLKPEEIKSGMQVYVVPLQAIGTILQDHANRSQKIQVQIGSSKMNIALKDLQKTNSIKTVTSGAITNSSASKAKFVSPEINVIGLNVDEAVYLIDKYLDDCVMAHLDTIRIVHGKGTGKLREGIHTFLKQNRHVKSFRLGTFGEGEMGVTVLELK